MVVRAGQDRGSQTDNVMANISSGTWGDKPEINFITQQLRRNAGTNACCTTYPCLHQIGQSHNGTSLVTEPLYIWGNTGTGSQTPGLADYNPNECPGNNTTAQWVQAGRDYVMGTKPGVHEIPLSAPADAGARPRFPAPRQT